MNMDVSILSATDPANMEVTKKNNEYSILKIDMETANTLHNLLHSHILEYIRDGGEAPDGLVEIRDQLIAKLMKEEVIYSNNEKINIIIKEKGGLDDSQITPDSELENDLYLDDLDRIEIIMALEDEFDVEISDEEEETFKKVQDIYEFIEGCLNG